MSNLIERAVVSAFGYPIEKGIGQASLPVKSIERRMRVLPIENDMKSISFKTLCDNLLLGVPINVNEQRYIAQLVEPKIVPMGGLVKKLSREVDKRTKNPKKSRGTIWRRNSTVKESRRQLPSWRIGTTAQLEALRSSRVMLFTYEEWLEIQLQKPDERRNTISQKKDLRARKKAMELEVERRYRESLTVEDLFTIEFMSIAARLSENGGITDESALYQRVRLNLENGKVQPVVFIWGPPYENQACDTNLFMTQTPENEMAQNIDAVFDNLSASGITVRPILIYADSYGTDINGIGKNEVDAYQKSLERRFEGKAQLIPWSQIRNENALRYNDLKAQIYGRIGISSEAINNASLIQAKLGRSISIDDAQNLARRYMQERIIEGQILTEGFYYRGEFIDNVIKLGTAPSRQRNDDPYEPSLPRLYIKNMLRAAWNKPRRTL